MSESLFYKSFKRSLSVHLFFGFNLLQTPSFARHVINMVCVGTAAAFLCFFLVLTFSSPIIDPDFFACNLVSVEYLIAVLATSIANTSQLYESIDRLDSKLGIGKGDYDKLRSIHDWLAAFLIIKRFLNTLMAYLSSPEYFTNAKKIVITILCNWVNLGVYQLPRLLYFILMLHRIKVLKLKLERVLQITRFPCSVILVRNATVVGPYKGILQIAHLYRDLIEDLNKKSKYINPLFISSLIFYLPKMMLIIYTVLVFLKKETALLFIAILVVDITEWAIFPSSSAIVVEMISHQVEQIKITLLHSLRGQKINKEQRSEIENFLRYMELRPFKYAIWRLVRVDFSLPVTLLGLCTTYIIVLVQLTRLYG